MKMTQLVMVACAFAFCLFAAAAMFKLEQDEQRAEGPFRARETQACVCREVKR